MDRLLLISLVPVIVLPGLFWLALKFTPAQPQVKKWVFAVLSAAACFIVIVPVPNFFILPVPNTLALIGMALDSRPEPNMHDIYIQAWRFALPSFIATLALFRVIAIFIFGRKSLPAQQNQPI